MASAGKIYLDAQLNTSNLKKQVTSLGKTLGQMKIKLDTSNYKEIVKTQEKIIENTKKALTLEQAINKQKKIEKSKLI